MNPGIPNSLLTMTVLGSLSLVACSAPGQRVARPEEEKVMIVEPNSASPVTPTVPRNLETATFALG